MNPHTPLPSLWRIRLFLRSLENEAERLVESAEALIIVHRSDSLVRILKQDLAERGWQIEKIQSYEKTEQAAGGLSEGLIELTLEKVRSTC